jgi:hypothetical protein
MGKTVSRFVLTLLSFSGVAAAQEPIAPPAAAQAALASEVAPLAAVPAQEAAPVPSLDLQPASDAELDQLRGGALVMQVNEGIVAGNSVGAGVTTGDITLSDSALSNMSGVFAGTFNSGNNVAIQTNLNVTINLD